MDHWNCQLKKKTQLKKSVKFSKSVLFMVCFGLEMTDCKIKYTFYICLHFSTVFKLSPPLIKDKNTNYFEKYNFFRPLKTGSHLFLNFLQN